MKAAIATLPGELFRTITWDQGAESEELKPVRCSARALLPESAPHPR
jgi:hypothetical protein